MKYEGFYVTTATVAPVLYLAFVVAFRRLSTEDLQRHPWVWAWNAIFTGTVFVAIEFLSLLVLSGAIDDTDGWRRELVIWTIALGVLLVVEPVIRAVMEGISARRATRER